MCACVRQYWPERVLWYAVALAQHPEAVVLPVSDPQPVEPLALRRAREPGREEAQREPVKGREGLAVHAPCLQRRATDQTHTCARTHTRMCTQAQWRMSAHATMPTPHPPCARRQSGTAHQTGSAATAAVSSGACAGPAKGRAGVWWWWDDRVCGRRAARVWGRCAHTERHRVSDTGRGPRDWPACCGRRAPS